MDEAVVKIIRENYHARDHNHRQYFMNNLGFGFVHYALIRNIRPDNVLVIGSQLGFVPAICGLACKDEGHGFVDFVDAGYELEDKDSWGGLGIWKTATKDYWKPLGLEDIITIYCTKTVDFEPKHNYQYIYIDGDHSFEGVVFDTNKFWDFLDEGGYMVLHDVCTDKITPYGKCGVKDWWEHSVFDEWLTLPFEAGLGIIRKC